MKIVNQVLLDDCANVLVDNFIKVADYLDHAGIDEVIITSGKRNGDGRSWHDKGLAIDLTFKGNIFYYVSEVLDFIKDKCPKITEFEVCRGKGKQHFHIATGTEKNLETFTGIYR